MPAVDGINAKSRSGVKAQVRAEQSRGLTSHNPILDKTLPKPEILTLSESSSENREGDISSKPCDLKHALSPHAGSSTAEGGSECMSEYSRGILQERRNECQIGEGLRNCR